MMSDALADPEHSTSLPVIIFNATETVQGSLGLLCNQTDGNVTSSDLCNETHTYKEDYKHHVMSDIVVIILYSFIMLIGIIGNGLVVIVVLCNRNMRSTNNLLILNLALADLLFLMFCIPFRAWDFAKPYWPFGDAWCRTNRYLEVIALYASVYSLVLMTLDRYVAIVHPIASLRLRTRRKAVIAIVATWVLIIFACIPFLCMHREQTYKGNTVCFFDKKNYDYKSFLLSVSITSYIAPLSLVFCLYTLLLKMLWFGVTVGGRDHTSDSNIQSRKRVTKLVIIVVLVFAVCWMPMVVYRVMRSLDSNRSSWALKIFKLVAIVMAYLNSCVNPILYAFLSNKFRKAFGKVFTTCKKTDQWEVTDTKESTSMRCTTPLSKNKIGVPEQEDPYTMPT